MQGAEVLDGEDAVINLRGGQRTTTTSNVVSLSRTRTAAPQAGEVAAAVQSVESTLRAPKRCAACPFRRV